MSLEEREKQEGKEEGQKTRKEERERGILEWEGGRVRSSRTPSVKLAETDVGRLPLCSQATGPSSLSLKVTSPILLSSAPGCEGGEGCWTWLNSLHVCQP